MLQDWLIVFSFIDNHPDMPQSEVVEHFKTQHEGALVFTQSTLSRRLKNRPALETRVTANPTSLSSKRAHVVTRPDVERALVLWLKHMEGKQETVSGPMLREKRRRFEQLFNVSEEEQLKGDGWLPSFCKAYKIKEHRRHGEAGSVSLDDANEEQLRIQRVLAKYKPKDRWNIDETSLNPL